MVGRSSEHEEDQQDDDVLSAVRVYSPDAKAMM